MHTPSPLAPVPPDPVLDGDESVWDYPRPPRIEQVRDRILIRIAGVTLADTSGAWRVLETSHPPTYFLPPSDVRTEFLRPAGAGSICEWKGVAEYWSLRIAELDLPKVAWSYCRPRADFAPIREYLAFHADPMDEVTVGGRPVTPQPGGFFGGWITPEVKGPFKGGPGTLDW